MLCERPVVDTHRRGPFWAAGERGLRRGCGLMLVIWGLLAPERTLAGGTWTPLAHSAPGAVNLMLLLSDGTVMAANNDDFTVGRAWYLLTPDSHGSYVNGTWTTLASMHDTRLFYSSAVLRDGRVFVAGGEYGSGTNSAEVYDPLSNTWTQAPPPPAGQVMFYDSISKILPTGNILIAPVEPATSGGTVIYNPAANAWSNGPVLYRGTDQDEASWMKLPDDSILAIDPFGTNSERYIPSLNAWINDGNVPVSIYDPYGSEMGAAILLPDGRALFLGATGHTALYTPSGNTSPGTWAAGPDIPNAQATPDAAAAMMMNGRILCAVSPLPASGDHFPSPTSFYEYDSVSNAFTLVNAPTGATGNYSTFTTMMLDLPDGTVLYSNFGSQLYNYQPDGTPLAAGKPAISGITTNLDGSYHITGTLFNGISEGAAYGDDAQMNSNYPLIRMTNSVSGNVYYARTFNWSSTGVMTGNNSETTDFTLPVGLPPGTYSLSVAANGISSDPVTFNYVPDALVVTPFTGFTASGNSGGPFSVTSQSYSLTNAGLASLNWSLVNTSAWLAASPGSGTLTPGGPATSVTVSLNTAASNLLAGTYTATVWFTNQNDGFGLGRQFTLQVLSAQLVQNGGFEAGKFTSWTQSGNTGSTSVTSSGNTFIHSGSYGAKLGPVGSLGYLSQTVPTLPGQPYLLSLWLSSPDGQTPNEFLVAWNGQTSFDQVNIPAIGWTNLQFIVTATASSTVLQFGFRDDPTWLGLDDISLTSVPLPMLQSAVKTNGGVKLTWNALTGLLYQVQYKTNLTQGNWINLGGVTTASNSIVNASDVAPADPQRFYRVQLLR